MLERLFNADSRQRYLIDRRRLRTRPDVENNCSRRKKFNGDLKSMVNIGNLEMNDYDVQSLHIPYGPGWDARQIDKLVYQTVSGFHPLNRNVLTFGFVGFRTELLVTIAIICFVVLTSWQRLITPRTKIAVSIATQHSSGHSKSALRTAARYGSH